VAQGSAAGLPVTNFFFNICTLMETEEPFSAWLKPCCSELAVAAARRVLPGLSDGGWYALPLAWSYSHFEAALELAQQPGGLHERLLTCISDSEATGCGSATPLISKLLLGRASGRAMGRAEAQAAELILAAAGRGVMQTAAGVQKHQVQSEAGSVLANAFGWVDE